MSSKPPGSRTRGGGGVKKQANYAPTKYRTLRSAWTPMAHRPSNEQIFKERMELISHWFDLWSDGQRKRFMTRILGKCSGMKILFNVKLAKEEVLIEHLDFSTVLPRFLCLYILSFLDPKTLSRAAQVSWHWRNLCEQDCLWMPKCMAQGWYLPYLPSELEHGAWKRHYIQCAKSLDIGILGDIPLPSRPDESDRTASQANNRGPPVSPRRSKVMTQEASQRMMSLRPHWMTTSKKPVDIEWATRAYLQGANVNDYAPPRASITFHDRYGTLRSQPLFNELQGQPTVDRGQESTARRHANATDEAVMSKKLLSECSLQNDRSMQERMASLKTQPWLFVADKSHQFGKIEGTMTAMGAIDRAPTKQTTIAYPEPCYLPHVNPRVLLISSKVPAYELLVEGTVFGVIPLVYDYDGATVTTILNQMTSALQGRMAECIGLFTEYVEPGEIRICRGTVVNWSSELLSSDAQMFFETLSLHTLPALRQGHVDIFVPLPSTDEGLHILSKLEHLSNGDTRFLSPLGLTADLRNQVAREWCGLNLQVEQISPPRFYFHEYKLDIWAHAAHYVLEAVASTRSVMADYFEEQHRELVHKVIGQLMFSEIGLLKIRGIHRVIEAVTQVCLQLKSESVMLSINYVAKYLGQIADAESLDNVEHPHGDSRSPETLNAIHQQYTRYMLASPRDGQIQYLERDGSSIEADGPHEELAALAAEESGTEGAATPVPDGMRQGPANADGDPADQQDDRVDEAGSYDDTRMSPRSPGLLKRSMGLADMREINASVSPVHSLVQSQAVYQDAPSVMAHVDLHKSTAHAILQTERAYLGYLGIVKDSFVIPLKRSIQSNRAVVGSGNLHTMFADLAVLYEVSSELAGELTRRMKEWSSSRFLGDVFERFCGKLGAFTNYIHNYPTILQIVKKNVESYPQFRAFVARHEKTYMTKMLGLHELLLVPFERIQEYITLLNVFKSHTPRDHADRLIIAKCLGSIKEVHRIIKEARHRLQLAKKLEETQTKILHCPQLSEPGRHFIMQQDFAVLKAVNSHREDAKIVEKYIIYVHEDDVGLFLFNDALVVAPRFQHFVPFQRALAYEYKFFKSLGLRAITLEDVLDSKYVKNAFKVRSSRHEWILAAASYEKKFDFLTALESCITADVPRT